MKRLKRNVRLGWIEGGNMFKKGGFTDIFLFMIISFIIVMASGMYIYIGVTTKAQLHATLDDMKIGNANTSAIIDSTFGEVTESFQSLIWISIFLIIGMIISIFIGSYLVTTKPIFFVPYVFVLIIAVVLSVSLSNSYELLITTPILQSTYIQFGASNFFMIHLPMWVAIIGFIGGIIMFSRIGSKEERYYYG